MAEYHIHKKDEERLENNPNAMLSSPGKKRARHSLIERDDFDFQVIRHLISRFYLEFKVVPTTRKLLQKFREDSNFPYCRQTLRNLLKTNGFFWRINHDPTARKFELFELVLLHRPPPEQKNYVVDRIIREHRLTPLRTPPYMCELNPIELAWAKLKFIVRSYNITGDFNITRLKEITVEAMSSISMDYWKKICQHVKDIEDQFWEHDRMMEETEPIIINLNTDDDSETESDDPDEDNDEVE
nr:unnamed protein product [Callosobruchus chinensis]